MSFMFYGCDDLETIYVDTGWSTAKVTRSENMFAFCNRLVGGQGTEYVSRWLDATYAHIDGGTSNPGYFTDIHAPRPYACYTSSNKTLTFYYDTQRDSRTGTTYDLNTDGSNTGWDTDGTKSKVTKVVFKPSFADARPKTTFMWFYNMENLQSITGMSYLNTSKVTNMAYMFTNCTKLTSLDVSHFNTSRVYEMLAMFSGCTSLTTLDLSSWETSQVYSFSSMFSGCIGLTSLDLSSFNTSQVEKHMDYMFSDCTNLKTIYVGNGWSTAEVMESASMFENCTSLKGGKGTTYDANHVDATYARVDGGTSNPGYLTAVTKAYAIYTSENQTLTFYNDDQYAFRTGTIYDLNSDTDYNAPGWPDWYEDGTRGSVTHVVFDSSFANARPTTTFYWFYDMDNLESITGMEYLNTSEVTDMTWMFAQCFTLKSLDLSHFNTAKVTDMSSMFENSRLKSLDLSSFNTSKVTNMSSMFMNCPNLRTIYVGSGWNTAAVTESGKMFYDCYSLEGGQGTTYNYSNPRDKTYARIDGNGGPGYFTAAGTEPYACYQNGTLTFYYDNQRDSRTGTTYSVKTEPVSQDWFTDKTNANVTRVVFDSSFAHAHPTNTYGWFSNMKNLQTISNIGHLNTSEVTSMASMFANCTSLTTLNLTHFNTGMVTNMGAMFGGCTNLRTIYVGDGWSTENVTDTYSVLMFSECTSLVGGQGTTWKATNPSNKTYAHVDGGPNNPGYFSSKAYAAFENGTLTFYYDTERNSRTGTTYDLNTGKNATGWDTDGTKSYVTKVVFDPSFAEARPTTTYRWFYNMTNLQAIEGICYLNTSEVTNMFGMFGVCKQLTSLDLSSFNTAQVTDMGAMFWKCGSLKTIYVCNGWSTEAVTGSSKMFSDCNSLVGGQGTTYDASHIDATYARIDGGASNPGYFTDAATGVATNVEVVPAKANTVKGIYTLDGRKLNELPTQKGVYIIDGRRVVIK
jgi:surface protein